ncbi:MAG: hypothetical protein MK116_00300 [Phycisphaerales bacterium]|nr:hypothetical protein [Phycisphaerales bacterium]
MKTMLATIGICVAMAVAGCGQKADTNTNLGAFDDSAPAACATSCATSCSSAAKAKASSGCCASKAAASCPMSNKMDSEVN